MWGNKRLGSDAGAADIPFWMDIPTPTDRRHSELLLLFRHLLTCFHIIAISNSREHRPTRLALIMRPPIDQLLILEHMLYF